MKIFLSFLQSSEHYPIPAYGFWEHYIKNGIEEAGHEWAECPDIDWAQGLVPKNKAEQLRWKDETWSKTLAWLKKDPADLFLSYLYPEQIDTAAIGEIRKMGIACVNFFCDNVRLFKKIPAEFAVFDLNWVPEFKAIMLYQKAGFPHINLPMPIWVAPGLRNMHNENNEQVSFIGSKDVQRLSFFEKVIQADPKLPMAIYGNGWDDSTAQDYLPTEDYTLYRKFNFQFNFVKKNGLGAYLRKLQQRNISLSASGALKARIHGTVSFDEYNKLTSGSMITLGINRYVSYHFPFSKPDTYSRLRDIEAPMLGACYLTEYTEGIEQLYEPGKEIELYKEAEDLVEKIKELRADGPKRKSLKINGQKRALQDHSISQSLNKILSKLNY